MIAGFLGSGYVVESSFGHIRDLPSGADEIPAKYKGLPWARLGVNVEDHFDPLYVVPADKRAQIRKLKDLLKGADELFLATDEDREGEAIAWHLLEELKPKVPVKRMVFHEITPKAIQDAVGNARDIDEALVDAQEARRILDRLYGYEVSPVLWKKVMPKLSAGRVQSVAIRMVVDRERERIAFRSASYWDLDATLDAGEGRTPRQFPSRLVSVDSRRVAQGRDFSSIGELKGANTVHLNEETATALAGALRDSQFTVRSIDSKPYTRKPYAPFRTTTLQQEAGRKLGMSASQTMQIAQRLYENGNITYMRTDSVTLSDTAITAARAQVRELYGASYLPDKPRVYTSKVKNAQEAHEAIRPAGEVFQTPAQTGLSGAEYRLYELIWMRTIASQMKDAEGRSVSIKIDATASTGEKCEFTSSGRVITFHGFLKAYVEGADDPSAGTDDQETRLPDVAEGDVLPAIEVLASGHETKPPARYTEATLIREMEEREIGRPSTYATILGTNVARGYIYKKGQALVPAWLAFAVVRLLEEHFTRLVDYAFTATMEDVLDEVAAGDLQREGVLSRFYFGDDNLEGLHSMVSDLGDIDAREMSTFPVGGDDSGIVLRVGRYGPYVEDKDERRANVPEDLPPDELTVEKAQELLAQPSGVEHELGTAPDTGLKVVAKAGPVRTVRDRGAAGGRAEEREAADRVAAEVDGTGQHRPRRRDEAAVAAAGGRQGPGDRRGDHRAERALRAVPEEGHGLAVAADRGADVRHHPRGSAEDLLRAEAAWAPGRGAAAEGAGRGPGVRSAGGGEGGPLRSVRDRRRDERDAAQGRLGRDDLAAARRRAARRQAGPRTGEEDRQEVGRQEDRCEEDDGQEDANGEEDHDQEDRREEDHGAKKTAAKKS